MWTARKATNSRLEKQLIQSGGNKVYRKQKLLDKPQKQSATDKKTRTRKELLDKGKRSRKIKNSCRNHREAMNSKRKARQSFLTQVAI